LAVPGIAPGAGRSQGGDPTQRAVDRCPASLITAIPATDPRIGLSGPRRERPAKPPCPPAQPGIPVPRQVPSAGRLDGTVYLRRAGAVRL